MPPNRFESEVESFLEGSHGDRTHIKRAGHHTVTPLCGTLLVGPSGVCAGRVLYRVWSSEVVQDEFRFLTHLEEIRRWSSRMRRGTLG